ncbi:MAG: acetyl-CoA C-acetyltransferase [Chloroflexi bacterium]|nr:acetyl-CoA C-acetyltransferase [Chloroflexota bacterium]
MREVVIVSGVRTAIGNFGGALQSMTAVQLGSLVIEEALKKAGVRPKPGAGFLAVAPDALKGDALTDLEKAHARWDDSLIPVQVDEVIMGNVLQAGQGQNPARQAAVYAGVSKETPVFTVNKVCASGLKAISLGAQSIMLEEADVVVAGGMESMSNAPYSLPKARWGYRMDVSAKGELIDLMVFDGLWEVFYGYHMGNTAENIVSRYGISRREQDEIGLLSHQRAREAIKDGTFKQEIVPVSIPQRRGDPVIFDTDERPMDTSLERMAQLAPVFRTDGTCTAGNSAGINDAAAAVVLMSREKAEDLGIRPMVRIVSCASGGVDPAYMGVGPVPAVRKALNRVGLTIGDIDVVELNEAFAAQAIACARELELSWDKTNIHGSGISLGHPIGCTGARLMVTMMHEMVRSGKHHGLVTMCIGGGQGMAMVVERAG